MTVGWTALSLLAFAAYVTVSLTWSLTPFPSLVTWLVFACLPVAFFGLSMNDTGGDFIKATSVVLQTAIAGLGAWGLICVFFLGHGRAGAPFDDANNFAALMNLGLMPALAVILTAKKGPAFHLSLIAALLDFGGLVATESRGGMLCFFLSALILYAMLHRQDEPCKRRTMLLAAGFGVLFALISFHAPDGGAAGRLAALPALTHDTAAMNRPILWGATLRMIEAHPMTGTGLGSFYMAYPAYRPLSDRVSAGQWAHNDPLQFAAETGIAALILFYIFMGCFFYRTWRVRKNWSPAMAGPACAVLAVLLHAHIEFQLYLMPILIVIGVWLADWYRQTAAALPSSASWAPLSAHRGVYTAVVLTVAALLVLPAVRCAAASFYLDRAMTAIHKAHGSAFMHLLDKADAWGPASFVGARVQRAALYIDLLRTPQGLFGNKTQQSMEQYVQTTLVLAEKTLPLWSDVNDRRAAYYLALKTRLGTGWEERAENQYRIALRKNPMDMKARMGLIALLRKRGARNEAYRLLNEGLARPHPVKDQAAMLALRVKLGHSVRENVTRIPLKVLP